ncbi:MAG: iron-containing alcohol dehydrogenase [Bacteroidota bacterium]
MENFNFQNPTRLHFGAGVTANLSKRALLYGKKALLIYGKSSIIQNGLYAKITEDLKNSGIEYFEYHGIKPNPLIEDVNNAAAIGRENNVDMIIAVGGGSVIDSAKIISLAIHFQGDAWDIITGKAKPITATPLLAVLTLAATGTEMNPFAVVQNPKTQQKIGYGNPLIYPKESFLDPINTLTVSAAQTSNGITDTIAHSLEAWFGFGDATLSDRFVVSIIKEMIELTPQLLNDLSNIDLRSRMLFASTFALNGITFLGRKSGDWGVHDIGHTLSVLYDLPHGATLSIAYPAWFKAVEPRIEDRLKKLGKEIFDVDSSDETISSFETFFSKINSPILLNQVNIVKDKSLEIVSLLNKNKITGGNIRLNELDYQKIVEKMFS